MGSLARNRNAGGSRLSRRLGFALLAVAVFFFLGCCTGPNKAKIDQGGGDGDKNAVAQSQAGAFNLAYTVTGVGIGGLFVLASWLSWAYLSRKAEIQDNADERRVWREIVVEALERLSYSPARDGPGPSQEKIT